MQGLTQASSLAAAAGIISAAYASGGIMGLSTMAIPGLLAAEGAPPQALAAQWAAIYNKGKAIMPKTALLTLACFGYLAYDRGSRGLGWWRACLAAGAATISIVPYTLIVMKSTNQTLMGIAGGAASSPEEVKSLASRWKDLNFVRALFPLAGSLIGIWALLG